MKDSKSLINVPEKDVFHPSHKLFFFYAVSFGAVVAFGIYCVLILLLSILGW